jgi:hypothetical protein
MTTSTHHVLVALHLSTHVPDILKQGHAIVTAMTGNANFPSPNPPLTSVTAALNLLDTTETTALTKAKGTAEARNAALASVKTLLRNAASCDAKRALLPRAKEVGDARTVAILSGFTATTGCGFLRAKGA